MVDLTVALNSTLYRWPSSASFGRTVPKSKFYERGKVSPTLRDKFVEEVKRITWAYKLADSTLHLKATTVVPEIQIFIVEAKGQDISSDVLKAIDKLVYSPILFEVVGSLGTMRLVAARKTLIGAAPKLGPYFSTKWLPINSPRVPLPTVLDLPGLYESLLESLLPVEPRRGESVSQATDRMEQARKLEREVNAMNAKLRNEPQFNRKVELSHQIRVAAAALAELNDPALKN